jgi:hypothetical protein
MGFALPDDGNHAPNEKLHLPNFYRGIATSIWFMSEFAARNTRRDINRTGDALAETGELKTLKQEQCREI